MAAYTRVITKKDLTRHIEYWNSVQNKIALDAIFGIMIDVFDEIESTGVSSFSGTSLSEPLNRLSQQFHHQVRVDIMWDLVNLFNWEINAILAFLKENYYVSPGWLEWPEVVSNFTNVEARISLHAVLTELTAELGRVQAATV